MGKQKIMDSIRTAMKDDKKRKGILLIGFLLIAIIFISSFWEFGGNKKKSSEQDAIETISTEQYTTQLEERVAKLLQEVDGVGTVSVMVTLENGSEYVYQSEQKSSQTERIQGNEGGQKSSDVEESIVMVEGESGKKQALVRTELEPAVRGIVVVCSGGDNITVQTQITDMLTTAFHVPSTRVSVVKSNDTTPSTP